MNRLEEDLKRAVRREDPSPGFADRVLRRIAEENARTISKESARRKLGLNIFRTGYFSNWRLTAAAVVCTLMIGFLSAYQFQKERRTQHEEAEGLRAKKEVLLALQITSEKLNKAKRKLNKKNQEILSR